MQTEIEPQAALSMENKLKQNGQSADSSKSAYERNCSPNPWLLSQDTAVPYKGLHNDLEKLANVQARTVENYRTVSVAFFNYHQSVLLQNNIYGMVKWGGVCNYIVAVWDEPSLEVCQSLNLPCFNATSMVPGNKTIGSEREARLHSMDYIKITWMKPILVSALLELGYAVHATDVDIAYAPADLMQSYLSYILEAKADAAFQRESKYPYIVNTGNYMVLPTNKGKALLKSWVAQFDKAIESRWHEQTALGYFYHSGNKTAFLVCSTPQECEEATKRASTMSLQPPIVRRTNNAWFMAFGNTCMSKDPHLMYAVHPCSLPALYFHAVCVIGAAAKTRALKGVGFWFLDDGWDSKACPQDPNNPNVVRCRPLAERKPQTEVDFMKCDPNRLAFNYYQQANPVVAAVDPALYLTPPKAKPPPPMSPPAVSSAPTPAPSTIPQKRRKMGEKYHRTRKLMGIPW